MQITGQMAWERRRKGCQLCSWYPPDYPVHELSIARVSI